MENATIMNTHANDRGAEALLEYSRAEAFEVGALIDVSGPARSVGFRLPVAITAFAHMELGTDDPARLVQILGGLYVGATLAEGEADRADLEVADRDGRWVRIWVEISPGDALEPVLTVMMDAER